MWSYWVSKTWHDSFRSRIKCACLLLMLHNWIIEQLRKFCVQGLVLSLVAYSSIPLLFLAIVLLHVPNSQLSFLSSIQFHSIPWTSVFYMYMLIILNKPKEKFLPPLDDEKRVDLFVLLEWLLISSILGINGWLWRNSLFSHILFFLNNLTTSKLWQKPFVYTLTKMYWRTKMFSGRIFFNWKCNCNN